MVVTKLTAHLALPLLNLLDVLAVNNVYRLQAPKFTHSWHKCLLPSLLHDFRFQYIKYINTTPAMFLDKIRISKVRTNFDKQTMANTAAILWDNIP